MEVKLQNGENPGIFRVLKGKVAYFNYGINTEAGLPYEFESYKLTRFGQKSIIQSAYKLKSVSSGGDSPTTAKWRKGGSQLDKIEKELETKHTIDFIFHNKGKVELAKRGVSGEDASLYIPTLDEILKATNGQGLPNWVY